jgi:drug/metabolite transporter (DMT)-like permease
MPTVPPNANLLARVPFPLLVATFCLLWSSAFAVAKLALADSPPLLLLTLRFLIAGVVTFGLVAWQGIDWRLNRRDLISLAGLGFANNAVYLGLNYVGMGTVSSGLAALIISANPVLTSLLAAVLLGEPMSWRKGVGLALGVGGVAFIVESRLHSGAESAVGILFVSGGLLSLVAGTILFKRLAPRGRLLVGNAVQNLAAAVALAPLAFGFESFGEVVPSWRLIAALAYLALLGSVCGYLLWFHRLTVSGATAASAYHFLMPPLGLVFAWVLLGEHVAPADLAGIVPVALGIYLVTRPAPPPPRIGKIAPAGAP